MKIWTNKLSIVLTLCASLSASYATAQQPAAGQGQLQAENQFSGQVQNQAQGQFNQGQPQGQAQQTQYVQRQPGVAPNNGNPGLRPNPNPAQASQARLVRVQPEVPQAAMQQTKQQIDVINAVLKKWEEKSDSIKNLTCQFHLWTENKAFNTKKHFAGELKYETPDKGLYHVQYEAIRKTPESEEEWRETAGEHWACDGEYVSQFVHADKKLMRFKLPEQMRGQAIQNSPLPFIFGASVEKLQARYWFVWVGLDNNQITMDAYPKTRQDLANYKKASLILDQNTFLPYALELTLPNDETAVHVFTNYELNKDKKTWVNFLLGQGNPFSPSAPSGWQRIDKDLGAGPQVPREARREDIKKSSFLNRTLGLGNNK